MSDQNLTEYFSRMATQLQIMSRLAQQLEDVQTPAAASVHPDVVAGQSLDLLIQSLNDHATLARLLADTGATVTLPAARVPSILNELRLDGTRKVLAHNGQQEPDARAGVVEIF